MFLPGYYINAFLNASGILVISGRNGSQIGLIATDLKTPHSRRGGSRQACLQFIPEKKGIIAIEVKYYIAGKFGKASAETAVMLLEVSEGKVNTDQYWQPQQDSRLCAIEVGFGKNFIRVMSESGNCYTNDPTYRDGEYHVEDVILLCKYVTGKIEEAALQRASIQEVAEISAQAKVLILEREAIMLNAELRDWKDKIRRMQNKIEEAENSANWFQWRQRLTNILTIIEDLRIKI